MRKKKKSYLCYSKIASINTVTYQHVPIPTLKVIYNLYRNFQGETSGFFSDFMHSSIFEWACIVNFHLDGHPELILLSFLVVSLRKFLFYRFTSELKFNWCYQCPAFMYPIHATGAYTRNVWYCFEI